MIKITFTIIWLALALSSTARAQNCDSTDKTATDSWLPELLTIPSGDFIRGSSEKEREYAYSIDEIAYGHSVTRQQQWYAYEFDPEVLKTDEYQISRTPITQYQYSAFIESTNHRSPKVTESEWDSYGLVHDFDSTHEYSWTGKSPPESRDKHPVVLVDLQDVNAYASWLSEITGYLWRLPTEIEWEKAARGIDGRWYPWGNNFDPKRANTHDEGSFSTTDVTKHSTGISPFGMVDSAGQVYEWTSTAGPTNNSGISRRIVKGGSWDDKGCGVCRPAARHSRPANLKHILIGFRLIREN